MRAMAVVGIFLCHYSLYARNPFATFIDEYFWSWMEMFFVLCGYLIANQLMKPQAIVSWKGLRKYYFSRTMRIWPAYLFVVALYFLIPGFGEEHTLAPLWKFLTFTQNLGLDYRIAAAFIPAWSLMVEEHFYVLLPLLILFFRRIPKASRFAIFLAIALASPIYRTVVWENYLGPLLRAAPNPVFSAEFYEWIYYPSFARMDGFVVGVGVAVLKNHYPAIWARLLQRSNWLGFVGLALVVAAMVVSSRIYQSPYVSFSFSISALAYGLILCAGFGKGSFSRTLNVKCFETLAKISFSFYLIQKPMLFHVASYLTSVGIDRNGPLAFAILTSAVFAGSAVLYLLIENPFLRFRDRVLAKAPST
jgi:peptidoglycan/LPS O-acetylase OafA/YrhL